ncbi:MAG: IS200/IS605 family transposase [Abditibacteriaceae bacterium]
MPQSLSNILVHVIFSTKSRMPLLKDDSREEMHRYIGGIIRKCGTHPIMINSVSDHIHLFFDLPRTMTIADLVKEIKTGSGSWIREQESCPGGFHWQTGYGAFSVSPEHKEALVRYIANQEEHHRKVSFQDEYRHFLHKYGIEYDEQYVWD